MSEPSEIPPELAALYAEEAAEARPTTAQRGDIRLAIGATLGIAIGSSGGAAAAAAVGTAASTGAGAATTAAIAGTTTKLVLAALVVAGIGGGALAVVDGGSSVAARFETPPAVLPEARSVAARSAREERPTPAAASVASSTQHASPLATRAASVPTARAPAPPRIAASAAPDAPAPPVTSTVDQRAVLAQAWAAIGRGDHGAALVLIEQARVSGPLDEERDALHVHVLDRLGRTDEARTHARAFLDRYPNSIHGRLITRLEESP